MAINFNVDPYFDDFDETKNFHRVLFKPGYAVQARELTQGQSILQNQITKFGNGIYTEGSKVSGGNITINSNIVTAKLEIDDNISNYVGLFAVGATSKFIAEVIDIDIQNYYIMSKPVNTNNGQNFYSDDIDDIQTGGEIINFFSTKLEAFGSLNSNTIDPIYSAKLKTENGLSRIGSATYLDTKLIISTAGMTVGDLITIPATDISNFMTGKILEILDNTTLLTSIQFPVDLSNVVVIVTTKSSVFASQICVDDGVWYIGGYFVSNYSSSIIPNPLSTTLSKVVGFNVVETITDSRNDVSLLDPAIGASNYQAPGADRYKISLELTSLPYIDLQTQISLTTNKFIELIRINLGIIENINKRPNFSEISKSIAQSAYEQSGDFIINPFSLAITDNLPSTDTFTSFVSAGKASIKGYPVERIARTNFNLQKSREYSSDTNVEVSTYYGNYIVTTPMAGKIINFDLGEQVELHRLVASSVTSNDTKIGTARIRNYVYDSGSDVSTKYKTFLFDIAITSNNFSEVHSLITTAVPDNYSNKTFQANVDRSSGKTDLIDNNYNSLIFPLAQENIKSIDGTNYVANRRFNAPTFNNGVYTITTNGSNEDFIIAGSSSLRKQYYSVVTTSSSGSYAAGTFIPLDRANVTIDIVNSSSTAAQATINIGGGFSGSAIICSSISITNDIIKSKVLNYNQSSLVSANTINTSIDIGKSDIYKFHGVYELGNTYSFRGSWSSATTYATNDKINYDNVVYNSTGTNTNEQPDINPSTWQPLYNNIANYNTDNGQRDAYYDHGSITNKTGVAKGSVVVTFDYFTHSGGIGFFDVNSYAIEYADIPSFTSIQYGSSYNLRDVLDFRPRKTDGAQTFDQFQLPTPMTNAYNNYSYYLSRIDKLVLYPNGLFKTIKGISAYLKPAAPVDIADALTLFTLHYPAYTFSKNDVRVIPTKLRRYTMRDIGLLDDRISHMEYYTSLSLSESLVSGSDVLDSTGNNILFKNGYLVDGFKGQGVGDVTNRDYAASIDFNARFARPLFFSNISDFEVDVTQGSFTEGTWQPWIEYLGPISLVGNNTGTWAENEFGFNIPEVFQTPGSIAADGINFITDGAVTPTPTIPKKLNNTLAMKNNIITFSYDPVSYIIQNVASEIVNVNPFNVVNFVGEFILSPASDTWFDPQSQPIVSIINEDQAAWIAAVNGTGHGTQWNDWNINWTGSNIVSPSDSGQISRDTLAIKDLINSKGLVGALTGGDIKVSTTDQIISNTIIPYCRSIPIKFELSGMPPLTELHAFINGDCIDSYIAPRPDSRVGLSNISIVNTGEGYINGNNLTIITITGANTQPAFATANVAGGKIVAIDVIVKGSGYTSQPSIRVTGSNTTTAVLTSNTDIGGLGVGLRSDINGFAEGTIYLPNNDLEKVPTGSVLIQFSDSTSLASVRKAYAENTFYAQGTLQTIQSTVISTRPPNYTVKPPVAPPIYVAPPIAPIYVQPPTPPTPPTPIPPIPVVPPNPPTPIYVAPVEYWRNSSLVPHASVLSKQFVFDAISQYLIARGKVPGGMRANDVTAFNNLNGTSQLYDSYINTVGKLPTVQQISMFSLHAVQAVWDYVVIAVAMNNPAYFINAQQGINLVIRKNIVGVANSGGFSDSNVVDSDITSEAALSNTGVTAGLTKTYLHCLGGLDPLSQNFYVDEIRCPNGLFLSSIDLFFATKDSSIPVSIRIRPTVNGYPDSKNEIPGSIVWKNPSDVNIPAVADQRKSIGPATTFTFNHPIYLPAGEFTIMVASNSNNYNVYESKKGNKEFGTDKMVSALSYIGSLFKSQNATTWVAAEGESLCFNLRRCDFAGGNVTFDIASRQKLTAVEYDLLQITSQDMQFGADDINYKILTKNKSTGILSSATSAIVNDNIHFNSRQIQNQSGDIIIRPTMHNINSFTSPVIDMQRLNTILIQNYITPYNSANTAAESLGGLNNYGGAVARYISRRVTLNNNFDSTGITVYLNVNRPVGTKIEVYYKVLNGVDQNNFDKQPYVLMPAILASSNGVEYTSSDSWTSDTYQSTDITYTDMTTGAVYTNFKTYAVKVVFYSDNTAFVPEIKNFRAIATA